ncbi:MAG: hypothetical protein JWM34_3642 [Ilumatobacteraceae bacterium]|nr:hypothetical protein [Ilumatobacteraceae bacterium]
MPSLKQLNEAIASYHSDHPDALMTVVVDATFGHRIDPKEVPEFETAIETNSFVAPPAGAVGRGDGFILSIAQKANASILSNDSYQEFHGEYAWLFDEGRLIGGKPVPHVGWVWVNRVPVRGPVSRRSVKEQKIVEKSPGRRRGQKPSTADLPSISADGPMPIPTMPPPNAVLPGQKPPKGDQRKGSKKDHEARQESGRQEAAKHDAGKQDTSKPDAKTTNDLLSFLSFVEHFPVGTAVTGVVETYSSHGAYVLIGDVHGYVPLRLMAEPAPRSAREVMDLGETVTLVVSSFGPARRSIDLAVPSMAPAAPAAPTAARGSTKKSARQAAAITESVVAEALAAAPAAEVEAAIAAPAGKRRGTKKAAAAPVIVEPVAPAAVEPAPKKSPKHGRGGRGATAAVVPQPVAEPVPVAPTPEPGAPNKPSGRTPGKSAGKTPAKAPAKAATKRAAKAAPRVARSTAAEPAAVAPVTEPISFETAFADVPASPTPARKRAPKQAARKAQATAQQETLEVPS